MTNTKTLLENFLELNHLDAAFRSACIDDGKSPVQTNEFIKRNGNRPNVISSAFSWDQSYAGLEFWIKQEKLYHQFYFGVQLGQMEEKFARQCSITGEGMNKGWVWGDRYIKYEKDVLRECRREWKMIKQLVRDNDIFDLETVQNEDDFIRLTAALSRFEHTGDNDQDLLLIAYHYDAVYYTEWEDDFQYKLVTGKVTPID